MDGDKISAILDMSYPIIPGRIGSLQLLAPQWVRYGPAVPGGYLRNRADLAQACSCTHREELHDRLDLWEVIHRLSDNNTVHGSWVSVVSHDAFVSC